MSSTQSADSSRDIHSTLYLETANYHSNFSDYCNKRRPCKYGPPKLELCYLYGLSTPQKTKQLCFSNIKDIFELVTFTDCLLGMDHCRDLFFSPTLIFPPPSSELPFVEWYGFSWFTQTIQNSRVAVVCSSFIAILLFLDLMAPTRRDS